MKTIRKFSEKLSSFDYIPAKVLEIAIIKSKIDPKSAYEIKKEDLNRYYNRKMIIHIKYKQ